MVRRQSLVKIKQINDLNKTEEIDYVLPGNFLGASEIVNNHEVTYHEIKALEDCDLFRLNDNIFMKTLGKYLFKADFERKEFLAYQVKLFYENKHKYYSIYKSVKVHHKEKNEVIHLERTYARSVFLIYYGECKLLKYMFNKLTLDKNIKAIYDYDSVRFMKILTLTKGDFSGLEATQPYHYYQYSLVVMLLLFNYRYQPH